MSALLRGLCGRRDHLMSGRALRRLISRYVDFEDLSEAAVPLHLVAFDLNERCELLLSDGPAVDAVVAAASIPGVQPTSFEHTSRLIGEALDAARAFLTRADGSSPLVGRTEDAIAA